MAAERKRAKSPGALRKGPVESKATIPVNVSFPIVGLAASAGGLQAFQEFLDHTPADCGVAFVIVSHQDPKRRSLLPDLLGRHTTMRVQLAEEGVRVEPNRVYVAPSDHCLALERGRLRLEPLPKPDPVALPIDHFLRSLALDQGRNAACVILSGNGSDGTRGLQAIKAEGGMVMAQEPSTAAFTGMPSSAMATGNVDYVLAPAEMPAQLLRFLSATQRTQAPREGEEEFDHPTHHVLSLLRARAGHDFSGYKPTTIRRRILRRLHVHDLKNTGEYAEYVESHPTEIDALFRELLIGVTSFFRDPEAFASLADNVLPRLLGDGTAEASLRVWVPGCSTGEEAYSIAILLREASERRERHVNVQIYATDLDPHSIDIARAGVFPRGIATDVGAERLDKYFEAEDDRYRITKSLRQDLIFATQNLVSDPPFTRIDLLSCRNLLIYLDGELQRRLIPTFHYALSPRGHLLLGASESIGGFTDLFADVDKQWRIFARKAAGSHTPGLVRPVNTTAQVHRRTAPAIAGESMGRKESIGEAVGKLLVSRYAPPSVIVTESGDIQHIHGRTGKYLEPAAGMPTLNLLKMSRQGMRLEIATALRRVAGGVSRVSLTQLPLETDSGICFVDVTVSRIQSPDSLNGLVLVAFSDRPEQRPVPDPEEPEPPPTGRVPDDLRRELRFTRESLQRTIEEAEATNEELSSTNEELQSANEELQSTNEELETSKEEMQSLNEELQTVNAELQAKIEELSQANDDMNNLMNSTSIATIFLGSDLSILRFTKNAKVLIKLIDSDVGRPVGDLVSRLQNADLSAEAQSVLETLTPVDKEVQDLDGNWYLMRIRPYRTANNVIDGLVVTFVETNDLKAAEAMAQELRAARSFADGLVETIRGPFLVLNGELRIVRANPSFCEAFQVATESATDQSLFSLGDGQWDIPDLRHMLSEMLPNRTKILDFRVEQDFPTIGRRVMMLNARILDWETPGPGLILLSIEDVSHQLP